MRTTTMKSLLKIAPLLFLFLHSGMVRGQYTMPEVMDTASLSEQLKYVQEKTRIYNDYRAVREDIFQRMKRNSIDSLSAAKNRISQLNVTINEKDQEISGLNSTLQETKQQLDEAVKNKNSLSFIGISMDKAFYNTIMWSIAGILAILLIVAFLAFKRSHIVTSHMKKEYEETRAAFEKYRKEARERYEKLVISHHNEIQKLKNR